MIVVVIMEDDDDDGGDNGLVMDAVIDDYSFHCLSKENH